MSYITEFKKVSTSNLAELSVKNNGDSYQHAKDAEKAIDRLLHSSGALVKDAALGWKMCFGKGCQMYAFSSEGSGLTVEDYEWIFQDCAEVGLDMSCTQAEQSCRGRNVYMLKYDCEVGNYYSDMNFKQEDHCKKLLETLPEFDLEIQVVGLGGDASGMILVIAKDALPVRIRSMFSMSFGGAKLCEVKSIEDTRNDSLLLPAKCFASFATRLFDMAMKTYGGNGTSVKADQVGNGIVYTEDMAIDELDLSVRSYNCLKRAGIHTLGVLRTMTTEDLMHVRNLGRKSYEEILEKLKETEAYYRNESESNSDAEMTEHTYSDRLAELIGLDNVKEQVRRITAYARMKKDMEALGMSNANAALNMEFCGNPGTAKTTVARIMAGILYEVGILQNAEILEVGRSNLVAKYTGQTADNVRNIFSDARGRLLFIDEAYSLVEDQRGQFGDEAINTIVQEMENHREDTVVVFAGYPDQMDELFSRNPGLRSRVPFHITFDNYSAEELVKIVEFDSAKRGFGIDPAASDKIKAICQVASKEDDFGNGRFCRNLVEDAMMNYAVRKYDTDCASAERDFVLIEDDFVMPKVKAAHETVHMGFC